MIIKKASRCLVAFSLLVTLAACENGPAPTRDEIVEKYPSVETGSLRAENIEVLCPFVRMLERSGLFDDEPTLIVPVSDVVNAAHEFGCASLECRTVANIAEAAQGVGGVDIQNLHQAGSIAHAKCGLTFAADGTQVDDEVRQATLDRLFELSDGDGHLVYDDIETVKLEICAEQEVDMSVSGGTEIKLIFAYLGGMEQGFVLYSDVERLLHAEMPETKTASWITGSLITSVK